MSAVRVAILALLALILAIGAAVADHRILALVAGALAIGLSISLRSIGIGRGVCHRSGAHGSVVAVGVAERRRRR